MSADDPSFRTGWDEKDEAMRSEVVRSIWGLSSATGDMAARHLLVHYNWQSSLPHADEGTLKSTNTHRDVLALIEHVKCTADKPCEELLQGLLTTQSSLLAAASQRAARNALHFALATWLFVDTVEWSGTATLRQFLSQTFSEASPASAHDAAELTFDAYDLRKIGKFKLQPTSKLEEHLKFDAQARRIMFFRHACVLDQKRNSQANDFYPAGLLRETSMTLGLLFPFGHDDQDRWRRRLKKTADIDVEVAIACNSSTALSDYYFWRDRLRVIQKAYDSAEPKSLSQWLHDWRKPNRTWTFWLAFVAILLALVFGLIQSVTGILQVALHH